MTATVTMPLRVWPGCLSCYNAGRLVGAWIDPPTLASSPS
ncbi:hypothetical protein HMPREF1275_00922 [Propionibacterium sp. KPL1844]|nr:hypothetical protein HMPREF1275_00922 [Propionibacterium sp. KPL1844]